jgi:hypothetical protein
MADGLADAGSDVRNNGISAVNAAVDGRHGPCLAERANFLVGQAGVARMMPSVEDCMRLATMASVKADSDVPGQHQGEAAFGGR